VHQFARLGLALEVSIGCLERAVNYSSAAVKGNLKNGLEPPNLRGRHNALADNAEADILAWIEVEPSTRTDIPHYCANKFGKSITRG
jgi:hypothetical protein